VPPRGGSGYTRLSAPTASALHRGSRFRPRRSAGQCLSSRENAAASIRQAAPAPWTRALLRCSVYAEYQRNPQTYLHCPRDRLRDRRDRRSEVIREMKPPVGKKTWRIRSPGLLKRLGEGGAQPAHSVQADVDDLGRAVRRAEDFFPVGSEGRDTETLPSSVGLGKQSPMSQHEGSAAL